MDDILSHRQEHGYGLPAWVMGAGATGVRVWVQDMATHTLTRYLHSGLAGEGKCCGVSIIFNCTVHPMIWHQTLSKTITALHLRYIEHNGLHEVVIVKAADEIERESSSIYSIKWSISRKAKEFKFKYLTCSSKKGKTGPPATHAIQQPTPTTSRSRHSVVLLTPSLGSAGDVRVATPPASDPSDHDTMQLMGGEDDSSAGSAAIVVRDSNDEGWVDEAESPDEELGLLATY